MGRPPESREQRKGVVLEALLVPELDPRTEVLKTCPRPLPAPVGIQPLPCTLGILVLRGLTPWKLRPLKPHLGPSCS